MRTESAIELQTRIFERIFRFTSLHIVVSERAGPSVYVDPDLLEGRGIRSTADAARHEAARVFALGISNDTDVDENAKLAVLVQDERQINGSLVEEIRRMAHDEAEIVYIGRQTAFWTRSRTDPLRMGSSISPSTEEYSGTLGCFCTDDETGDICILSNNHVLAGVNSLALGTSILQPSIPDGGRKGEDEVAELLRMVPIEFGGLPNLVDAAIARLIPADRKQDRTGIFDCGEPSRQVKSLQPQPNPMPVPGMDVFKTGRSTCHTAGRIRAVNVNNYLVDMGTGVARFDGQIVIETAMSPPAPFSRPGDSGSVIVDGEGRAVGLLFAGSQEGGAGNLGITGANSISNVLSQSRVSLI